MNKLTSAFGGAVLAAAGCLAAAAVEAFFVADVAFLSVMLELYVYKRRK